MENNNLLETLAVRFGQNASVKNVFGDPITAQGKTIIPVAQIAYGLGGGYGHNGKRKKASVSPEEVQDNKEEGAGAGGGMYATPKGVYEISGKSTRFIPANATKQLLMIAVLAFIAGRWMGSKKCFKP
jgi:uncharacterized spore protein YtfJ